MSDTATPTTVPALTGYRDNYRLWTVEQVPFDRFPARRSGGPSMVVTGGWGMSTSSVSRFFSSPSVVAADDGMFTLSVYGVPYSVENPEHPLDGTRYATQEDADRAAYEAGVLAFMVYVKDEAKYGIEVS